MDSKSENEKADLVQYARDCAGRGDDLYALLGVDATTDAEDIHRSWRKRQLLLHPDKAGAAYDPAKLDALNRARDVLLSEAARAAYDNGMRAALLKRQQYESARGRRRELIDDLERRENEAKRARAEDDARDAEMAAEKSRMAERGRRRMEERARLVREAEERDRLREGAGQAGAPVVGGGADMPAGREGEDLGGASVDGGAGAASGAASQDDLDERIAKLERILRDKEARRAERAARRAERKARKGGVAPSDGLADSADGGMPASPPARVGGEQEAPPPTKALDASSESKADERTEAAPVFSIKSRPSSGGSARAASSTAPNKPLMAIVAETVARLRARQAEIDARGRA